MSLRIRLARVGTKKRPVYHIVIADSRAPRDGRYIERLGYFNPLMANDNKDRLRLSLPTQGGGQGEGGLCVPRVRAEALTLPAPHRGEGFCPSRSERPVSEVR